MTVLDAQLGRPLTQWEALWVEYTGQYSDFQLFALSVLGMVAFYTLASAPYAILDYLQLPFFEQYRLQGKVYNSTSETWKCFLESLRVMLTIILPVQLCSYPFFKASGITTALPLPTFQEVILQLLIFLLIEDYGSYWLHRWMHSSSWFYQKVHYKHHEYRTSMGVGSDYAHWCELLVFGFPTAAGPALMSSHLVTLWIWLLVRQWEAVDTHSGYHFPWSPTRLIPFYGGSEFHDYHHLVGQKCLGNYGSIFSYCDSLYGTDKGFHIWKKHLNVRKQ